MIVTIFCSNCSELILDHAVCLACGRWRPVEDEGVGAEIWSADLGTRSWTTKHAEGHE